MSNDTAVKLVYRLFEKYGSECPDTLFDYISGVIIGFRLCDKINGAQSHVLDCMNRAYYVKFKARYMSVII